MTTSSVSAPPCTQLHSVVLGEYEHVISMVMFKQCTDRSDTYNKHRKNASAKFLNDLQCKECEMSHAQMSICLHITITDSEQLRDSEQLPDLGGSTLLR